MSWDTVAPTTWNVDSTSQATATWTNDTPARGAIEPENVSKHGDLAEITCRNCHQPGHYTHTCTEERQMNGDGCFNCGQAGHNKSECTEPRQNSGECFNCGQTGHNKADCTNEAIDRPFTGECRNCGEQGHRGSECPRVQCRTCGEEGHRSATCSQAICRKCNQIGHNATDCTEKYAVYPAGLPDITSGDIAWHNLIHANDSGDVDDFVEAFWVYCKVAPELTLPQLEECFRETNFRYYLIAKEQLVASRVHTNVDLQGNAGKTYQISIQKSLKPRRTLLAEGWPKTPEENSERLQDAGFPMDKMVTICSNCDEVGHAKKNCPQEVQQVEKLKVTCSNCNQDGHYIRDCTEPRATRGGDMECKHCSEIGHMAKDCPTKPAELCRNCQQEGHRAFDCPNERVMLCRNCKLPGHLSRECPEPLNLANVKCTNCEQMGHFMKECPEPKDWSKVKCRNCGEFGHGAGRCTVPAADEAAGGGADDFAATSGAGVSAEGDWMNTGSGGGAAVGSWDAAPAAAAATSW